MSGPDVEKAVPMATEVPVAPTQVATVVAMPMTPVAGTGPVGGGLFTGGIGYNPPVPTQRWKKELCECCADNGLCCAACCCPFITIPQLHEKYLGKKGSCPKYAVVLLIFYVAYNGLAWSRKTSSTSVAYMSSRPKARGP